MRTIAFAVVSVAVSGCVVTVDDGGDRGSRSRGGSGGSAREGSGGDGGTAAVDGGGGAVAVPDGGPGAGGGADAAADAGHTEAGPFIEAGPVEAGSDAPACVSEGDSDTDGDGFTIADGDCNDCDANSNPGAYDWPGDGVDQDCSGTADDEVESCDDTTPLDSDDPINGARAIGLCRTTTADGTGWGVISAKYVQADGSDGMPATAHGILPGFGDNVAPREGTSVLALSSGTARRPTDPDYESVSGHSHNTSTETPTGFPIDSPSCSVTTADDPVANDSAALEITLRAPTNIDGLQFSFNFYTYEFPTYVCSTYNDFFVALVDPAPNAAIFGNISFDSQNNPVSVNNAFLEVCSPRTAGGKVFDCFQGTEELAGTGFDNSAATGWLLTQSAVAPGEVFTIRYAIWDAGDHSLDSTVLVDQFAWTTDAPLTPTTTRM